MGGKIGIGTGTPRNPLSIRAIRLYDPSEELLSFEDPNGNTKWHINQNLHGTYPGLNFVESGVADGRLFIKTGGNIGIGTLDPKAKLDIGNVPATGGGSPLGSDMWFRIGDGGDGGRMWVEYGQQAAPTLVLSDYDDPPRIWLQQIGKADSGSDTTFSEENPKHVSWIGHAKSESNNLAIMGGNVGIGTDQPQAKLQIAGDVALEQRANATARTLPTGATLCWNDGTWLRLNQNLDHSKPIFGVHTPGVLAPGSLNVGGAGVWGDPGGGNVWITGNVGIGTTNLTRPLSIRASGVGEELIIFEDPNGNTKWHINQNLYGKYPGLNFVESGVADGRLFIQTGGNVGIGTTSPEGKLSIDLGNPQGWDGNKLAIRLISPDFNYHLDVNTYVIGSGNVGYQFSPSCAGTSNTGLVISTFGNVGIGTTNPGGIKLSIADGADDSTIAILYRLWISILIMPISMKIFFIVFQKLILLK
jgi:hypothetical protein